MEIYFRKPQDEMPEDYTRVLVRLERNESEEVEVEWSIGYYDGTKWCHDVPLDFLDQGLHMEREICIGQDLDVTHWAEIPKHPGFNVVRLSDIPPIQPPSVRFNRQDDLIEIFGGSSNYSEEDPYYLERNRFGTPAAALNSMAHIAGKTWATEKFMHRLARVLDEALAAGVERIPPAKVH